MYPLGPRNALAKECRQRIGYTHLNSHPPTFHGSDRNPKACGGKTLLVMHELYPSKEALDIAGTGAANAMDETIEQLDELLETLGPSARRL